MKLWEVGGPGIEGLVQVERDVPEPGPDEVLLKMRAASLNYRDLLMVKGQYPGKQAERLVPLSDGVGEVAAIGQGVTRVQAGDRVAGNIMQSWLDGAMRREDPSSALGGAVHGILAEYVVLHQDGVVRVPEHLSDEQAATLPCAALTAWHALISAGHLQAGQTVLTLGTGGVSIFALQFAKMCGATVVITSSSDEKLARATELGADHAINYKQHPDWEKQVFKSNGSKGVDQVIEVGGVGTLERSLKSAGYGGQVSLIGVLTGTSGTLNTAYILQKNLLLRGIYCGSRTMFEAMNAAIAANKLRPVVDRVFGFDQAPAAYHHLESATHFGKIAISIG